MFDHHETPQDENRPGPLLPAFGDHAGESAAPGIERDGTWPGLPAPGAPLSPGLPSGLGRDGFLEIVVEAAGPALTPAAERVLRLHARHTPPRAWTEPGAGPVAFLAQKTVAARLRIDRRSVHRAETLLAALGLVEHRGRADGRRLPPRPGHDASDACGLMFWPMIARAGNFTEAAKAAAARRDRIDGLRRAASGLRAGCRRNLARLVGMSGVPVADRAAPVARVVPAEVAAAQATLDALPALLEVGTARGPLAALVDALRALHADVLRLAARADARDTTWPAPGATGRANVTPDNGAPDPAPDPRPSCGNNDTASRAADPEDPPCGHTAEAWPRGTFESPAGDSNVPRHDTLQKEEGIIERRAEEEKQRARAENSGPDRPGKAEEAPAAPGPEDPAPKSPTRNAGESPGDRAKQDRPTSDPVVGDGTTREAQALRAAGVSEADLATAREMREAQRRHGLPVTPLAALCGVALPGEGPDQVSQGALQSPEPEDSPAGAGDGGPGGKPRAPAPRPPVAWTFGHLHAAASPDFRAFLDANREPDGALTRHSLMAAADTQRHLLDIGPGPWGRACHALGREGAALALLVLDANRAHPVSPVRNPAGVLTAMAAAARTGTLDLDASLFALLRRGGGCDPGGDPRDGAESPAPH